MQVRELEKLLKKLTAVRMSTEMVFDPRLSIWN